MQAFLSFVPDVATLQRGFAAFVVLLDNGLPTTPSRIRLRRSGHQMLHKKVRITTCHTQTEVKQKATNNLTPFFS